jgi:hypothetical protein
LAQQQSYYNAAKNKRKETIKKEKREKIKQENNFWKVFFSGVEREREKCVDHT